MSLSTFQKVTLATCLVLCVALLLPKMLLSRGKKDAERQEGRFPPMPHRQVASDGHNQRAAGSHFSRAHNPEAIARAKGSGTGAGTGGKSNLAGQIIPIYGFGILLYILYILFKITSKGSSKPADTRFPSVKSENMKRKITDFELAQLQEKLKETELVMENIVSNANHSPDRVKGVSADQEESLLLQLREITRVMQEGRLVEGMAPENTTQHDWEDYPKEPRHYRDHPCCPCHNGWHTGPQTEPEAERTEADGADGAVLAEDNPDGDITDSGEAEEPEVCNGDKPRDAAFKAMGEEDTAPEGGCGVSDKEDLYEPEPEEEGAEIELGLPEEDLAGVLKELELTLRMTSMMEQEKIDDLTHPKDTAAGCTQVRRRNKKRRVKKEVH
ncbi:protein RIC-3b [Lampris incognitus]|uniref:protein RIC-3b n=1 Tax=Lampris incognitus TaxID=2546036 RepID=UPI0024B4A75A|nr:protein RIC-3b [Lampris incognitus]